MRFRIGAIHLVALVRGSLLYRHALLSLPQLDARTLLGVRGRKLFSYTYESVSFKYLNVEEIVKSVVGYIPISVPVATPPYFESVSFRNESAQPGHISESCPKIVLGVWVGIGL